MSGNWVLEAAGAWASIIGLLWLILGSVYLAVRGRNRVSIAVYGSTTNLKSESWARWYHIKVWSDGGGAPLDPQVAVRTPGSADHAAWYFAEYLSSQTPPKAIRREPLLVPIIVGNLDDHQHFLDAGYPLNGETWHLTPNGLPSLTTFPFLPNTSLRFEVRVSWLHGGSWNHEKEATFVLRFKADKEEPEFVNVRARWRAIPSIRRTPVRRPSRP